MIDFYFIGCFALIILIDYFVGTFIIGSPWAIAVLLILESAVYFLYLYLKSSDRYLRFQPKYFTKSWHKDIEEQQNQVWDDLHVSLESFKQGMLAQILEDVNQTALKNKEVYQEISRRLEIELKSAKANFKEKLKDDVKLKDDLDKLKHQVQSEFEQKAQNLHVELLGFMYHRDKESKKDLKRMTSRLNDIGSS